MDDKKNVGTPDRDLINTNELYELEYWSTKFGISVEELKSAVKAAGNSATAVKKNLANKK